MLRCSCTEIHAVFGIGRLRVSKAIPSWVGFALLRQAPGLERFSIEYQSNHWPSTEDNPVNQSQLEVITCSWRETRENVCGQVSIGFGFTSDWMKKWREFFKPIAQRGK